MFSKKPFSKIRKYVTSVRYFESIRDDVMDPNYHEPRRDYLNELANMELHLRIAKGTGLPTRKYYREFRKVKRELRRRGVSPRVMNEAVRDAVIVAKLSKKGAKKK